MFTAAGTTRKFKGLASDSRRKLLTGAGGAALVLSLAMPSTAWAHDYTVGTEAELRQAILDANGDGDATSTITLTGDIAISGALPTSTKALIINTAGFSTNGITPQGIVTLTGTIKGNNDVAGGNGQAGLTITGPATTTVINNAAITGGDGTSASNTGLGVDLQDGTLTNNGTITGGSSGGPGSTSGGYGIQASRGVTIVNNGTIQGGTGQGVTGGVGAFIGVSPNSVQTFTNNASGIVRGGDGTGGALGGVGIEVKTVSVPIVNHGLIEGGNGAAAIKSGPNVNIINDGTISAGAGGLIAIDASASQLTVLELRAGYSITGQVIANAGATFAQTLQFGGDVDAGFDMSDVGTAAQYRGFNRILKTGTSIWTLTGDVSGMPTSIWNLQQGTLLFDKNTAGGAIASMINSGSDNAALIFQQDSTLSVGNLNGAISVLQNGLGTTILTGNNHSLGTTLASGTLSIGIEQALGSGAFTITGGTLQWTGNGNIARSINWAASGAEIEVTGTALTLAQPLLGGGTLTKSGTGTLTLTGDNTYTGGTTITAGTLRVNGSILGDVLDNGTLTFGNSTAYTYAGLVTGTGNLTAAGTGLLTLTNNSSFDGAATVSGTGGLLVTGGADITYGGTTTVSAGQLLVNAGSTMISAGATAMTSNSATLTVDGAGSAFSTASMNVAGSNATRVMAVNVTNGGHLDLTAGGLSIRTLLGTARFTIDGAGSLADITGGLLLASIANTGGALTISGGGALQTAGASTVGVAAGNAQNGGTRLLDVTITGTGSNWTSTNSLLMTNGNFTLDQGGQASFANATFGSVSSALPATLTVSGTGSKLSTTTGDLVIGSGTGTGVLTLNNGASVDVAGTLVLADATTATGILNIGGAEGQAATATGTSAFTVPAVSLGSTTSRINFNHTSSNYTFASTISGVGSVHQVAGTTTLTAANSYTGGTFLSGGTLSVSNDANLGDATSGLLFDGGTLRWAGTSFTNTRAITWGTNGGGFNITSPGAVYTVSQALIGGGPLTKSGTGTLTLSGANSYTGGTFLNAGAVSVANDGNLGDAAGALNFNGGRLQWTGGTFTNTRAINWGANGGGFDVTNAASIYVVTQALTGSGGLNKLGAGTLALSGDSNYTGVTRIDGGTLRLGTGGTTGSIAGDVVNNGTLSFSRSDAWSFGGAITGTGSVTSIGGGITTLTGNSSYDGDTNITGGGGIRILGATVTSDGSSLAQGGSMTVDAGGVFNVGAIAAQSSAGVGGSINVVNGGILHSAGNLMLRSSPTAIVLSTLNVSGAGSLADVGGGVLIATSTASNIDGVNITGGGKLTTGAASTMGFSGGNTTAPFVTIDGAGSDWTSQDALTITNGNFSLTNGGTASFTTLTAGTVSAVRPAAILVSGAGSKLTTTAGNLVIGSGTGTGELILADGASVDVAGSLVLGDSGTATGILSIGGAEGQSAASVGVFTAPAVVLGSATSRLNFNHNATDYIFSAVVSGAGGINQVAGDTNLTGNSAAFIGTTNVTGGKLRVNGTLGNGNSVVNVLNGGTLGGAGTIGGNVFITNGVLAPGNSPGTLTINGNLSLTSASLLDYEFGRSDVVGGPLNDLTMVGGNLDLAGTINVTVTPGGNFDVGLYRVISYGGALTDNGLAVGTVPAGSLVQSQTSVLGQVNLVNIAGADVNFWDGGGSVDDNIVSGGTGTWQGAGGNSNWTLVDGSLNTPYPNDAFAIFAAAGGTVTVDAGGGAVNASGMQFASDGYTITGDAIGLTGTQSVIRVGDGTAAGAGYTATIASALNGTGDLVKTDLGTLVLTGAGVFAGETQVTVGALRLADGGTLSNTTGYIAYDAGNQASVTVTGEDGGGNVSTWSNSGDLVVGQFGTGTLSVTAGGVVSGADSYVGASAGGLGTVTVSGHSIAGAASSWSSTGFLRVGDEGTGTLTVQDGGLVHADGNAYLGYAAGSVGTATVTGRDANGNASSLTSTSDLVVGESGTGTLNIVAGGLVSNASGWVGSAGGGTGTVTVSGTDGNGNASTWTNSGNLAIGNAGTGTLNIAAGGKVTSGWGYIGWDPAGTGHVLVTGTDSAWESTGRISVGSLGAGDVRIEAGGRITSDDAIIGTSSHGEAVITGAGSIWTMAGQFTVGLESSGTVRIEDGASVVSSQGYIGANAGGSGSVTVTGAGSTWLAGPSGITVGHNGDGSLSIDGGARVRAEGGISLGTFTGVTGTLTLQGTTANRAVLETSGIGKGDGVANVTLDGALIRATDNNSDFISGFDGQDLTIGANSLAVDTDVYNIFVSPNFIGSGALIKDGSGALVLSGDNSYTGGTTINAGALQLGVGGTTGSIVGNVVNNGDFSFYRSDAVTFGGLISGSGSVTQWGPGTLTLTAANTYAGATNVSNDGTLLINGDQSAATGLTIVAAAATLGGTGIIGGSVDMSAGGTLAPGAGGVGLLTINGGLTLGADSKLAFELGQAGTPGGARNDLVNVGGNLTLDGTVNVAVSAGGTFDVGIYRVLNYAGSLTNNGLLVGTQPAGADVFVQTSVAGQVNLVNIGGLTLNFWDGAAGPKFDSLVNGGNGVWQAHTGNDNWTDLSGALNAGFSDGAVAIFTAAPGTVTVDNSLGAVTASGMQFATDGYTITGGDVTLTGAQAVIRVGDNSAASAGYTATIASVLTGASQLVKTDLGTLVLTSANSYAGGTRIEGGTLSIGDGGATGSITGDIVNNAALVVNRTGTLTLDGAISGSGSLTQLGGGTLILSGTNSYAGGTNVGGASILEIASDANLGDAAGTLSLQGATLRAGASFLSGRSVLLNGASNIIDTQGFNLTLSGVIGDGTGNVAGNAIVKFGTGTLTLSGVNSYANRTQVTQGTLALAGDGTIGAADLTVDTGAVFDISQVTAGTRLNQLGSGPAGMIALGSKTLTLGTTGGLIDWSGTIADGGIGGGAGGSVTVDAPAGTVRFQTVQSYTGGTTVNAGTFALAGAGGLYAGGAVAVNAGATFDIAGLAGPGTVIGDLSGAGTVALGGKALTFGTTNSTSFTGTISGNGGSLVKSGTGTFSLTGANSYTGASSVNAGTLLINGDQSAATGLTSVASGATLGGSGIIGGDVLIADGGTLSPGNGAGTLTINGGLTLSAGSALAYEFGAANSVGSPLNDLVNVGGNLVLDGTINVAVSAGGAFDIGLYRVANYGGTLTDNGLAIGTMPAGAELSVQTSIAGQVNLINTGSAVLNFWDGNAGPKFDGAIAGGNGVWQATGTDNWTDATGKVNSAFDTGAIAIFAGTAGVVTIDNSQGAVTASGLQFAANGTYRILGDTLTLTGPQSVIRVGDGTAAGNSYIAEIQSVIAGNTQLVKTDLGRLILSGTNSYTGGTAINGGVVQIASDANLGAAAGGLNLNGGTLDTTGDISSARGVTLTGQGVFSPDAGTTLTLTGAVTGTGSLAKTDTGTLVLAGTGSFTGGTLVAQGTLLVNGNYAAATGLTTVAAGAILGGTGTIGGNVTLNGTLAPGAGGAGTLTIGGNLSIAQGATLAYEFGAANVAGGALNDLVTVGGNLVLDGTINVNQSAGGTFGAGVYRVFNYGGTLTDNGLTLGALPAGSNVAVQTSIAGQVNLVNYAGLTLNFWDGAAGPKNNGTINGGTGIWQNGTGNDNWTDASGAANAPYSDGAFAVFGGTAGTVTVDNGLGQVAVSGMQFAAGGYTITGGSIALTGAQATIRVGDGSTAGAGYTATINAALSGASQLVKTDAGTLVLGGTNGYTGGTLITGGTVQIASDANLGAASGGVTFDGGALATTATFSSARNLVLQGAGTLSTANGTVFTLNGMLSGTGALVKAGTGTLELAGNNAGYTGATRVSAGTLAVTGSFGGPISVDAAGRLEGTGSVGAVTNAGTIAPGRGGVGTLTLTGNYTSTNGTLEIEAELGGDGARADRLVVGGATAGNTLVKVTNLGGTGAPTVEGIKIVDVAGASNGVFTLDGDYVFQGAPALIAGAYGYRLYKNGVAAPADGDWYLRSALLSPAAPPATPLYQPGVPVYEAYGQTLATLNAIGTMQERVGNRRWSAGSDGISGIWGRMESARSRPNAVESTSLSDVNVDSWKTELGVDQVISTRSDGSSLIVGVLGSYGEARANIASPFGNGSIKTRGYSAGATMTWFGPQGFYVDGRAQLTWFDSTLKSTVLGKLAGSNGGTGQAYSVEVGKRSPLSGTLSVTPQIQMAYSTTGFDSFTDPNGAVVSSRLGDSLKTRWGISLDRQDDRSHVYGVVNLSYEWLDGTVTEVSGTPIARSNERLWGELGMGGSILLGKRVTLFSELSVNTAIHDFGKSYGLKGVGGLRLAF